MAEIVIKFDNAGSEIDLYDNEAVNLEVKSMRNIDVFQFGLNHTGGSETESPFQGTYGMYYTSNRYREFIVKVITKHENSNSTLTKLETIRNWRDDYNQPKPIKMYYEYLISTSNYYYVQLVPDTFRKEYSEGYLKEYAMNLRFVESRPEGAGVMTMDDLVGGI